MPRQGTARQGTDYAAGSGGSGPPGQTVPRPGSSAARCSAPDAPALPGSVRAENPVHGPDRFAFLLTARVFSWLRLSQREDTWKTAEIMILRHQPAVLQPRQPGRPSLNWADRALLATLLRVIPKAPPRNAAAGHPRHDPAPAPRHRPPPGRQVQARQDRSPCHPPEHQGPGPPTGPREPRMGLPQDPPPPSLDQYRVVKQARVSGLINEYRLLA
jgi:hypothetical protein